MYFSLFIIAFILLLSLLISYHKKHAAIKKVCSMTLSEKCIVLNELISPLGYCYDRCQDIISSRKDAWQREFGYTALFDYTAPHFNMVFDWFPVYFDYAGRTWLAEFWKGQYGINSGGEIGLYYADEIIPPKARSTAHFNAVADNDMLSLAFCLTKNGHMLSSVTKRTWWLTAFTMGLFSKPQDLYLNASLRFRSCDMMQAFLRALSETELPKAYIHVCGLQVHLQFGNMPQHGFSLLQRISRCKAQLFNCFFCRLYLFVTRFFTLTIDRLLYLYYLLPGCFFRCLRLRRCNKKKLRRSS